MKAFRYANLQPDELGSTLVLDAEEAIQAEPQDICIDWWTHEKGDNGPLPGKQPVSGIMVAAARDRVERHLELLRLAGLYPVELGVRCLAGVSLFSELEHEKISGKAVHFSYLAGQIADMAIVGPDGQVFPRSVNSRGETWADAPAYLAEQIDEQLKFHEYKLQQRPVEEIYVTGEPAASDILRSALHERIGVPVHLWDPFADLQENDPTPGTLPNSYGLRLIAAVGLAVREAGHG